MKPTNPSASAKEQSEELDRLLLVPLDGSSIAEEALPAAAAIARRTGARVHLATVIQQMPAFLATGEEPMVDPELEQELRDQTSEYLNSTAEALGTTHGLEVSYAVLDGSPAQALADHARAKREPPPEASIDLHGTRPVEVTMVRTQFLCHAGETKRRHQLQTWRSFGSSLPAIHEDIVKNRARHCTTAARAL